ncbi:hypothetical protein [Nocardioides daeguensis]|uniref:hypothetical protein n=1 Tax=Nocardioides daeguensis TaxID=908359 RepID=UPI002149C4F4|nr:hypothetical protein [Nocardioides daeguensis]MCR1772546.1 hypothetical protein [Nocardioides daeguensis]
MEGRLGAGLRRRGEPGARLVGRHRDRRAHVSIAFGPRPGADGRFSWDNGSRLYYANLTSPVGGAPHSDVFRGFEAIAVSYVDDVAAAAAGSKEAWSRPVLVSQQSTTTFSDKEQVWADNASSSPYFGSVYVCWASFRSNSHGQALPTPLTVARSSDGGTTWTTRQGSPATDNGISSQPDGCTVRTDSHGTVDHHGTPESTQQRRARRRPRRRPRPQAARRSRPRSGATGCRRGRVRCAARPRPGPSGRVREG